MIRPDTDPHHCICPIFLCRLFRLQAILSIFNLQIAMSRSEDIKPTTNPKFMILVFETRLYTTVCILYIMCMDNTAFYSNSKLMSSISTRIAQKCCIPFSNGNRFTREEYIKHIIADNVGRKILKESGHRIG